MGRKHLQNPVMAGDAVAVLEAVPKQQLDAQIATRAASSHGHTNNGELAVTPLSAGYTPDVASNTQFSVTVNQDLTLNEPTNGVNGQPLRFFMLANGASRIISLNAAIINMSGYTFPATVPSGKRLALGLVRSAGTWYLLAVRLQP